MPKQGARQKAAARPTTPKSTKLPRRSKAVPPHRETESKPGSECKQRRRDREDEGKGALGLTSTDGGTERRAKRGGGGGAGEERRG